MEGAVWRGFDTDSRDILMDFDTFEPDLSVFHFEARFFSEEQPDIYLSNLDSLLYYPMH